MEIYVIDPFQETTPHFPVIGVIKSYQSVIWNPQLYGLGAFEITLQATNENVSLLRSGRFLYRAEDYDSATGTYHNAMVIREKIISYDADAGYLLKVTGKQVKDILSQRIIWNQVLADNEDLNDVISTIFASNISDPVGFAQAQYDNWGIELQNAMDEFDAAYATYQQAVVDWGEDDPRTKALYEDVLACQAAIDNCEAEAGAWDTALSQQTGRAIPYMVNGIDSQSGFTPPKITAQLRGENIGEWMENTCIENKFGWDLELTANALTLYVVIGTDRTSTVIFSPDMDNLINAEYVFSKLAYRNSGLVGGDGEGDLKITGEFGASRGISRFEQWLEATNLTQNQDQIPKATYVKMLKQYGKSAIQQYTKMESITAEIDTDGVYKIGKDFAMGDKVTVNMNFGVSATARLIEIIYSDEPSGHKITGVFEEWEV